MVRRLAIVAPADRILTVPNAISLGRLACVPLFLWLLFSKDDRFGAALHLGAHGGTDWVDGYIARHFNQVSTLGKVLDPTADRVLLGVGVLAILVDGALPMWVGVITIVREVAVSAAVIGLAALGARRVDVQWVGKAGTFALMVAFPFFLASHSNVSWHSTARGLAWLFALPGIALSWYAAATYVPIALEALREGRAARSARVGSAR